MLLRKLGMLCEYDILIYCIISINIIDVIQMCCYYFRLKAHAFFVIFLSIP